MNEQSKLYRLIQNESFAIYETALYLDGHPKDKKGLKYFNEHNDRLRKLTEEYETEYGPLVFSSVNSDEEWNWTSQPWPWEYESV